MMVMVVDFRVLDVRPTTASLSLSTPYEQLETFRLNFSATANVIGLCVQPVLSRCYYLTFYYAIVDFEMALCYSSHSKKISD